MLKKLCEVEWDKCKTIMLNILFQNNLRTFKNQILSRSEGSNHVNDTKKILNQNLP